MQTTTTAEQIRTALAEGLAESREDLAAAYLFGSVARGTMRESSDVDVAVLYRTEPPRTLEGMGFDLGYDLSEKVGRTVDVVVLNRAPADLVHRVLRDGVLLLERDRSARVRFEVAKRAEYFDLLPYLEQYRAPRGEKP